MTDTVGVFANNQFGKDVEFTRVVMGFEVHLSAPNMRANTRHKRTDSKGR
jgi:hypothetical protein